MELGRIVKKYTAFAIRDSYNFLFSKELKDYTPSEIPELQEIQRRALLRTDINDHLVLLFSESLVLKPKLIVELGTRGGESTFVLERTAKLCDADLISVDIADCSQVCKYPKWHFIKSDDIALAKTFKNWCRERNLPSEIDVLYIDTSHEFQHTVQEIESWFPFLSAKSKVIFHDTNMRFFFRRNDGSLGVGWDNKRGVIEALEKYLGCKFKENLNFVEIRKNWLIRHWAHCNGFTVLERRPD